MNFDRQLFTKHQSKLLWIANHKSTCWLLGLNRLPQDLKGKQIVKITPNTLMWVRAYRGIEVECEQVFFTRPRFAEALAYNLSPFCYFADYRRQKMVWRFSPVGLVGLLATLLLPKFFGGIAFFGTTTDYPTGAGDGYCGNYDANYSTARNATSGNNFSYTADAADIVTHSKYLVDNKYYFGRGFLPVDLTDLPDSAEISSAAQYFYVTGYTDPNTDTLRLVPTTQASETSLGNDDYDQCGTTDYGTMAFASLTTSAYNSISLNATGLAAIPVTGYFKIGLRSEDDIAGNVPTNYGSVSVRFSEYTGSASDPYFRIVYTVPVTFIPQIIFI